MAGNYVALEAQKELGVFAPFCRVNAVPALKDNLRLFALIFFIKE